MFTFHARTCVQRQGSCALARGESVTLRSALRQVEVGFFFFFFLVRAGVVQLTFSKRLASQQCFHHSAASWHAQACIVKVRIVNKHVHRKIHRLFIGNALLLLLLLLLCCLFALPIGIIIVEFNILMNSTILLDSFMLQRRI